jgi:hypothetical protein
MLECRQHSRLRDMPKSHDCVANFLFHDVPMDWVRPTDEVLAKMARLTSGRSEAPAPDLHYATARDSTASS